MYTQLAPQTPEKNAPSPSRSSLSTIPETPHKLLSLGSTFVAPDLQGQRIVEHFGDKTCQIKHFFDTTATFDDFDKVITNCSFYLQFAAKILSKSLKKPDDQKYFWLATVWKNWSYLDRMPNKEMTNWEEITFVIWDMIMVGSI